MLKSFILRAFPKSSRITFSKSVSVFHGVGKSDQKVSFSVPTGNFGDIFRLGLGGAGEWTETDEI